MNERSKHKSRYSPIHNMLAKIKVAIKTSAEINLY